MVEVGGNAILGFRRARLISGRGCPDSSGGRGGTCSPEFSNHSTVQFRSTKEIHSLDLSRPVYFDLSLLTTVKLTILV